MRCCALVESASVGVRHGKNRCTSTRWLLALVLLVLATPVASAGVLFGNLTYESGHGGIVWGPSQPTETTAFPDAIADRAAAWTARARVWTDPADSEASWFESEPVPRDLYLNVTRPIEVRMVFDNCRQLEIVVVLKSGTRVASQQYDGRAPPEVCSENDRSQFIQTFLLQPEVDTIEKRSVIRIGIYQYGDSWTTMKVGGNLQSHIKFHLYTPLERLERYPLTPLWDSLPLLLLPLALRGRAQLPILMVALLLSAGCLGAQRPSGTGDGSRTEGADVREVDPDENVPPGTIFGTVYDDRRLPLAGVVVLASTTSNATQTDRHGEYRLAGLPAGKHVLQFARRPYVPQTVPVDLDRLPLRVDVTLNLTSGTDPFARPHQHGSHWRGVDRLDLWNGSFPLESLASERTSCEDNSRRALNTVFPWIGVSDQPSGVRGYASRSGYWGVGCEERADGVCNGMWIRWCPLQPFRPPAEHKDGLPVLVPPGTSLLEVEAKWSIDGLGRLMLKAQDNFRGTAAPWMGPRPSGAVYRIPVAWEMADNGHQTFSTWTFHLRVPTNTAQASVHFGGEVQLRVTAIQGTIPLEAPHRDFWKGQETFVPIDYLPGTRDHAWWSEKRLVPPGTTWLEVDVDQSWDSSVEYEPVAWTAVRDPSGIVMTPLEAPGALYARFGMRVCPLETDEYYQHQSRWIFRLRPEGGTAPPEAEATDRARPMGEQVGIGDGGLMFALTVRAHRTDPPAALPQRGCDP